VVAALTVLLLCWFQRRRAKQAQGPRLFHNQRHSHYPVAPSSVTRPAPMMAYTGPDSDQGFKRPLDEYTLPQKGGPPQGYRPGPPQGYRPPPMSEKPPPNVYFDDGPPQRYDRPPQNYDRPPQGYRPGAARPTPDKVSLDSNPGERSIEI
jgi:hypothetical protein